MSTPPSSPVPAWGPPKNPLPPHRLARLANALGVSTPMPATYTPSPLLSPSYSGSSSTPDQYRRSPTPSTASGYGFPSSTSRFLLHVIPPNSLPHDSDSFDSDLTPPPSTASGYHTQFRRGTLVPVHPTLQSQLGAIAKEYALPSTAGLILYLVLQRPTPGAKPSSEEMDDEPGPRMSEDIWRRLWTRVAKAELRDEGIPLAPPLLGLGISNPLAGRSTPYLARDAPASSASATYPLFLLSTQAPTPTYPFAVAPSPTTPSSDAHHLAHVPRIDTKSAPPSSSDSHSPSNEDQDPDTPATSHRADSLDLPGLSPGASAQLVPILAKVEFDIDKRRAAWYEPWLRSRRLNHAKRKGSVSASIAESSADEEGEGRRTAAAPLAFRLGSKKGKGNGGPRYLPLSESPKPMLGSESDVEDEVPPARPQNPLASDDGEDEEDDMTERRRLGPDTPGMRKALSLSRRGPPTPLVLRTPSSASPGPPDPVRLPYLEGESEQEERLSREELEVDGDEDDLDNIPSSKSTHDPEKRGGGFYDDMDFGFDFDTDDPNDRRKSQFIMRQQLDEIEKNLAQFSPRKLATDFDFNEQQARSLAAVVAAPHLSPPGHDAARMYAVTNADVFPPTPPPQLPNHPNTHPEADDESDTDLSQQAAWPAVPFTSLPDRERNRQSQSSSAGERSPPRLALNGVSATMPKRFRANSRASTASAETEARRRDLIEQQAAAYPAMTPSIGPKGSLNSPLIPLSPDPFGRHPSSSAQPSPDVFGGGGSSRRTSGASYWEEPVVVPGQQPPPSSQQPPHQRNPSVAPSTSGLSGTTSRFSTDSMNGEPATGGAAGQTAKQANRTTMMSVKTIKKLWRKSQKNSVSGPSVSTTANGLRPISTVPENIYSPLSPPPPQRPNRPSMEDLELPDVDVPVPSTAPRTPTTGSFGGLPPPMPSQQPVPRPSLEMVQQQLSVPPAPRPTPDQYPPPPSPQQLGVPPSRRPSQDHGAGSYFAVPPQMNGIGVPMLRSPNMAPIVAAKAGPPRKQSADGLHWDQESPYPTRTPSRAPSVTSSVSRPPSAASFNPPPPRTNPSPPPADRERNSARKSILKWKSTAAAGMTAANANGGGPVPAPLTPSAATFRSRKSSISGSPSQGAPINLPPDIPPSPRIPEQFMVMNGYAGNNTAASEAAAPSARPNSAAIARRRLSAKMASTATADSAATSSRRTSQHHRAGQESMASSYASEEMVERSSFDTSGFEIVSPKMGEMLSFPYHEMDRQERRPPAEGVRIAM